MPYERAGDKDNTPFYKINLEFTGFEENPPTITLANWSPQPGTILDIVIPALPKPNISGFRGWKIKQSFTTDIMLLNDSEQVFTKGQLLKVGCQTSKPFDFTFYAMPVIAKGISFGVAWGEF